VLAQGQHALQHVGAGGLRPQVSADQLEGARADLPGERTDLAQHARDRRITLGHADDRLDVRLAGHFTRAPGGRSRSRTSTASAPSSSVEPASTIPCDWIPISLAGSRFATTTTFLPTRSAGA